MIPDISPSKYRTILLQHLLKKSEGEEARSPENFGWGCVPCVLKPWHCFPTKIIEFLSTLFVDFILDCCSQKGFYMTKNHPTPLPTPPNCTDPGSSRAQNLVQFLALKGMGLHKPIKLIHVDHMRECLTFPQAIKTMELMITSHLSNTSFFFFLDKQADSLFLIILCCLFKSFACKISRNILNMEN